MLQTLKLQTHLVMDLNRNVRDLGMIVTALKKQLDATNEQIGILKQPLQTGQTSDDCFKSREVSGTSDSELLQERQPVTPTAERNEQGFFSRMDSNALK